jgi:uncharacterized protein (TIGR02145 family)
MKKAIWTQAAAALMLVAIIVTGCKKPVDPNNGVEKYESVDLSLPSGTLWATCNLGSTTPEGYGSYLSWGETEIKSLYTWDAYKYCNGSATTLTKYCNNADFGNEGFTDNLTVLEPADDVATAVMGNDWCIPSIAQWEELIENTNSAWTTRNGVNGCLFTASNGNTLFLPAADRMRNEEVVDLGNNGFYWSNEFNTENARNGSLIKFTEGSVELSSLARSNGTPIRAVRAAH